MDLAERQQRVDKVNELLKEIGSCGRKFFYYDGRFSHFTLDKRGRIWFVDKWTMKQVYMHIHYTDSWRDITEGGTLKYLLISLKDYIMDSVPVGNNHFSFPSWMCDGDPWMYGEDMSIVRDKAKSLGIWKPKEIKLPEILDLSYDDSDDLILDPDDEDVWYDFKCKEREFGEPCPLIEEVGERADCVSISPRGGFSYCPSLFITVSGDTIKKKMKGE